jgi:hypothetical protein
MTNLIFIADRDHMRNILLLSVFSLTAFISFAQTSERTVRAVRTNQPVKIDGELNDDAWKSAPPVTNFIEQRPVFGRLEDEGSKTEAYILYDDNAVYVAAFCHETGRDSISKELVGRDRVGVNDFAGVMFDTYLDKINGVGFYVTALGEQYDCKYSLGNEDGSWSTVYQTATKILDNGWSFEMRIPYSALRFSKEKVQSWGINFVRRRTKTGRQFMWSPVDPNKFGLMNQAGIFQGIEDIRPPLRLSFSPYLSTYVNNAPTSSGNKSWTNSINGGMDVKYGISKGFTLDMTLVPDFGQVQSDNQVLNLSPFEVRYNENRSFFTEGTELFNKGNLFYSRRIGGRPLHYGSSYAISSTERLIKNPSETKLINATKISGRTSKGLGIGFFNAVTKPQYAVIENEFKQQYKMQTDPLTNYNILVLDQTMKNNSSVSLINTNVLRNGKDYDANVTAALWDLYDKKVNWNFWGKVSNSKLFNYTADGKTFSGYNYEVNFGKFRGPLNFEVHQRLADNRYQQNDLGYFTNNNYLDRGFYVWYKWMKPKGFYNNFRINIGGNYSQRYAPRSFQYVSLNLNANSQLKNLWNLGISSNVNPQQQDFYESRTGKLFKIPGSWMAGFSINTNSAKKYSANFSFYDRVAPKYHTNNAEFYLGNQYRFNDKLTIGLNNYALFSRRNAGFAYTTDTGDSSIFGLRNRHTVENVFSIKYNFNIKMGITLNARHYWSKVQYTRFYNLKDDGYLEDFTAVTKNPDINVNLFNIDMIYTWQFAQGSFINIAWKNATQLFNQAIQDDYYHNLHNTLNTPQQNNFSVKIIYYLDYLSLKTQRRSKQNS